MTYKEFGEKADINVEVTVTVNDEQIYIKGNFDTNDATAALGYIDRHELIKKALTKQYESLPESEEL